MMMEIPINQRPRIDIYGPYPEFIENIVQGDEKPLIFVTHCTDKWLIGIRPCLSDDVQFGMDNDWWILVGQNVQ